MDPRRRIGLFDVRIKDGAIVEVGPSLPDDGAVVIDAEGCAVLPGLIHAHMHLCQVLFRNAAEDRALLPWLRERIWPLEAAHDPISLRASAELGIAELLKSGATSVLDMGTVHHHDVVFEAARELGIRLCSGKAMMDSGDDVPAGLRETTHQSLSESDRLRKTWQGAANGRLSYAYAPRFVLSCSDELLDGVATRLKEGARLHTHASENQDEVAFVRQQTGLENIELLNRHGLLSERSTIAHGVFLSDREVDLLAQTRTSVAHCPTSNLKLASGIADVPRLLKRGVRVALGADGAPCNNNLDLWQEMKLAGLLPRLAHGPATLSAEQVLEMGTLGGARALGLEHQVGSLETGKRADVIVVDLQTLHSQPIVETTDLPTALVYATRASDVRTVLVNGAIVVENGRLVKADERAIVRQASAQAKLVRARA
jgi:5-methylthioadenosine/S-adenosylhomocysteine deaminase